MVRSNIGTLQLGAMRLTTHGADVGSMRAGAFDASIETEADHATLVASVRPGSGERGSVSRRRRSGGRARAAGARRR